MTLLRKKAVQFLIQFAVEVRVEYSLLCLLKKEIGNGIRKQSEKPFCEARVFVLELRVHVSDDRVKQVPEVVVSIPLNRNGGKTSQAFTQSG